MKSLGKITLLFTMILALFLIAAPAWAARPVAKVTSYTGEVLVISGIEILPVSHVGQFVSAGDKLQTKQGSVQITFTDGASMKVSPFTTTMIQERQEGFGHAVYCARHAVGNEPFLLMLGDHRAGLAVVHARDVPPLRLVDISHQHRMGPALLALRAEHPLADAMPDMGQFPVAAVFGVACRHAAEGFLHVDPGHDGEAVARLRVAISLGQREMTVAVELQGLSLAVDDEAGIAFERTTGLAVVKVPMPDE